MTERPRPTILLVDDDPSVRRLLEHVLVRVGYDVDSVASSEAAKAAFHARRHDLLLLDLKLDDTDAPQLVSELTTATEPPPFIVITGQGDERAAVQMMKLGALDYLVKDSQLTHLVASVIERAFSQIEIRRKLRHSETQRRQLERALLEVSERERRTVGRDLHDGVGQRLTAVSLISHSLCEALLGSPLRNFAQQINRHIRETITEIRRLARGLAPVSLEGESFDAALIDLAELIEAGLGVKCTVSCPVDLKFADPVMAVHLYRIVQEALTNALKHSSATQIQVTLERNAESVRLEIADNGSGLPEDSKHSGMGLRAIDFRIRLLGGRLELISKPGQGVRIICVCPDPETQPAPKPEQL